MHLEPLLVSYLLSLWWDGNFIQLTPVCCYPFFSFYCSITKFTINEGIYGKISTSNYNILHRIQICHTFLLKDIYIKIWKRILNYRKIPVTVQSMNSQHTTSLNHDITIHLTTFKLQPVRNKEVLLYLQELIPLPLQEQVFKWL